MSWDPKAFQFYCFTCREKIDLYSYYQNKGLNYTEMLHEHDLLDELDHEVRDERVELDIKTQTLNDFQIKYLEKRGIMQDTASYFKVSSIDGNILIPYYNAMGEITGGKIKNFKANGPKYTSVKGSNFGLFNKCNLVTDEPLIITEGEFDCMILYQVGFNNVSSIGTGANSLDKLFRMEEKFLEMFKSIIVIADNDSSGQNMEKFFVKKLGLRVKLTDKNLFNDLKDLNDVFLKYGETQIKAIVKSASSKIEGLRNLDIEPYEGIQQHEGKFIPTGLSSIDYAINDLGPGILTLVTGRSNGGKSTLVNQIVASAINNGHKSLLVAGEGLQELLINNLYKAVIGRNEKFYNYKKVNKRYFKEPTPEVLKALQKWHYGKLTIFNKGDSKLKTTDDLMDLVESEIKINPPDLLVVDNLMSILSVEQVAEKYESQADFTQRLSDIAKAYKIHIILVLHPNKSVTKGSSMDFEQISGSSDLYNKADVILAVKRNYDDEKLSQGKDGEVSILKNRYYSDLVAVDTYYDKDTGLLLEIDPSTNGVLFYKFNWEKFLENPINDSFETPEGFREVQIEVPF